MPPTTKSINIRITEDQLEDLNALQQALGLPSISQAFRHVLQVHLKAALARAQKAKDLLADKEYPPDAI